METDRNSAAHTRMPTTISCNCHRSKRQAHSTIRAYSLCEIPAQCYRTAPGNRKPVCLFPRILSLATRKPIERNPTSGTCIRNVRLLHPQRMWKKQSAQTRTDQQSRTNTRIFRISQKFSRRETLKENRRLRIAVQQVDKGNTIGTTALLAQPPPWICLTETAVELSN